MARHAAVTSPHVLASVAGLGVLDRGGTAVDAMVAVNAALGVLYPHMTGPGGDAFWLIHDAAGGTQDVLNASGRAGAAASRGRFKGRIDARGAAAACTVPGAVDGWVQAHARFGRLPLRDCLRSAVEYARAGIPVSDSLAGYLAREVELLRAVPTTAAIYLKRDGTPYQRGELLRNLQLADTLESIGECGRDSFYDGQLAREMCEYVQRLGGLLTVDDFAGHHSDWVEPISVGYRGHRALATPPNSQGFAALQILGILDHIDVADMRDDPIRYIDQVVRATALAFEDRDRYLCDLEFFVPQLSALLDETYLAERALRLRDARPALPLMTPAAGGDTTFSCAVDREGNAAGVTQSLFYEWGSGVIAGKTGVLMHNRGSSFSLDPEHPNSLEPSRRTAHTLIPAMLVGPSGLELVYGTMGGEGQPQTEAVITTRVIDHGHSVQQAIDEPRWLLGRTWGEDHRGLRLEGRFGTRVIDGLTALGHENVTLIEDFSDIVGHAQAIQVFPDRLEAAADPRSDGAALGT